jgi:hypothetical protein
MFRGKRTGACIVFDLDATIEVSSGQVRGQLDVCKLPLS